MQGDEPVFIFHKAQALLYYLAVTGRPHQRSALLNLLWSHIPENNRKNNLRVTLSYLRKHFGNYLLVNRHTISFDINAPYWLDVHELRTTLQSSTKTMERLQEVVKLYQGSFLEGFQVPEEKEFETWVANTRKRLQDLVVQALYNLALRHQEQGNYAEGIECLNRLLTLQPLHEESHQLLMFLLASSGQRSAALEQYEICRQWLGEHKRAPSAELTKLYDDISTGKVGNGIHLVPQTVGHFVEPEMQSRRHLEGQRQITVMYCHWHDSHAQATVSPETWLILQQYVEGHFVTLVNHFGGQIVHQYNGGLLVAFSGAGTDENNAQHAIQCGLKILETFESSGQITTHQLSVAIHTGQVLMEKIRINGHQYLNLIGQPLEIVQQLARYARPETLLISDVTHSLVKERFPCQPFGATDNADEPVVYQVQFQPQTAIIQSQSVIVNG
jgi:DNA-binding SARP family transcriptional activator